MDEELNVKLPTEEQRRCPVCGTRVALQATTCLMCGASLVEEEAPGEVQEEGLPNWAKALIVVGLALVILAAGTYGFYEMAIVRAPDPTPTPTITPTPTVTPTPSPTTTPSPAPTATPIPPIVHQVQAGETLITIAQQHDTTVDAITSLNPGVDSQLLQVGQILLIPVGTPTPLPTATFDPNAPTPTPGPYIHIVAPGESLLSIAQQYGVSVALIQEINELPIGEDTIFVNQTLVIPLNTPEPTLEPTRDPLATPTPIPPRNAPYLLNPPDGQVFIGEEEPILLQWASVGILRVNRDETSTRGEEYYEVILYQPPRRTPIERYRTRATSWRVPVDLLREADPDEQTFEWEVRVVREEEGRGGTTEYQEASLSGDRRSFIWLEPTPTPTATITPPPAETLTPTAEPSPTPSDEG